MLLILYEPKHFLIFYHYTPGEEQATLLLLCVFVCALRISFALVLCPAAEHLHTILRKSVVLLYLGFAKKKGIVVLMRCDIYEVPSLAIFYYSQLSRYVPRF